MNFQYISDKSGNRTGVILPIELWEKLKSIFKIDIEKMDIPDEQIREVRERMEEYNRNPDIALDFKKVMGDIEKEL